MVSTTNSGICKSHLRILLSKLTYFDLRQINMCSRAICLRGMIHIWPKNQVYGWKKGGNKAGKRFALYAQKIGSMGREGQKAGIKPHLGDGHSNSDLWYVFSFKNSLWQLFILNILPISHHSLLKSGQYWCGVKNERSLPCHRFINHLSTLCLCLWQYSQVSKGGQRFLHNLMWVAMEIFSLNFGCVTLFLAGEDLPQDLQMRSKQYQVSRRKKVKVFILQKHRVCFSLCLFLFH